MEDYSADEVIAALGKMAKDADPYRKEIFEVAAEFIAANNTWCNVYGAASQTVKELIDMLRLVTNELSRVEWQLSKQGERTGRMSEVIEKADTLLQRLSPEGDGTHPNQMGPWS